MKVILKHNSIFNSHIDFLIKRGDLLKPLDDPGRKRHSHDFIEIAFVNDGRGIHYLNGKSHETKKGDIFIINYESEHCFYTLDAENTENLSIINCCFVPEFIDNLKIEFSLLMNIINVFLYDSMYAEEKAHSVFLKLEGENFESIDYIFSKMLDEYTRKEEGYEDYIKLLLYELLISLYRLYKLDYKHQESQEIYKYELIKDALSYLKDNFSEKLNLARVSDTVFLSKNYFCRIFKEVTGVTVFDYIQKLRINKACDLLLKDKASITDIAGEVGYCDYRYFIRVFKKATGKTPSEYRRLNL